MLAVGLHFSGLWLDWEESKRFRNVSHLSFDSSSPLTCRFLGATILFTCADGCAQSRHSRQREGFTVAAVLHAALLGRGASVGTAVAFLGHCS